MEKEVIATQLAPQAVGAYSQGIKVDKTIYFSGQIPLDPKTGAMVANDIESQIKQVMTNIQGLLTSQGLSFDNIVKTTIFLTKIENFGVVNTEYAKYFKNNPPARSTVGVAALPKDALVEIECIAVQSK